MYADVLLRNSSLTCSLTPSVYDIQHVYCTTATAFAIFVQWSNVTQHFKRIVNEMKFNSFSFVMVSTI